MVANKLTAEEPAAKELAPKQPAPAPKVSQDTQHLMRSIIDHMIEDAVGRVVSTPEESDVWSSVDSILRDCFNDLDDTVVLMR